MTGDEVELERDLGLLGVTMIGVGAMIDSRSRWRISLG
jgi:hypothetical protein